MDKKRLLTVMVSVIALAVILIYGLTSGDSDVNNVSDAQYTQSETAGDTANASSNTSHYIFRYPDRLTDHFKKHGIEMGFDSEEDYLAAANAVIDNPDALYETEAEDGDEVYFVEATGEIVFLSRDGYIRTYFIADKSYFLRQAA